ncbi:MAG: helix-turn-helix domain-containing protein [Gorillibacterium sp.]|nr:helix-turn-helix domain-containing protein [Gorillibacterium sp.]
MNSEHDTTVYGDEEGDFYYQQIYRTQSFGRVNHYHRTYEIYYLLSGQRSYFVDDRAYHVTAGDMIFINKQIVHKSSDWGPPQHERIVINFSDAFLGKDHPYYDQMLFRVFEHNDVIRLNPSERLHVQNLLGRMTSEVSEQAMGFTTYIRLLLTELLLFAARRMERNKLAEHEPISPVHQKITDVVKYINDHFHEKLSLSHLSNLFFVSPSHLSRTFKVVTGLALTEYVNLTRIKEAQRLLRDTDGKIIDIAQRVGFENTGHFDRIFKKITETTPLSYRKIYSF